MTKEKDEEKIEIEKTKVMSLSTLSTEVEKALVEDEQKEKMKDDKKKPDNIQGKEKSIKKEPTLTSEEDILEEEKVLLDEINESDDHVIDKEIEEQPQDEHKKDEVEIAVDEMVSVSEEVCVENEKEKTNCDSANEPEIKEQMQNEHTEEKEEIFTKDINIEVKKETSTHDSKKDKQEGKDAQSLKQVEDSTDFVALDNEIVKEKEKLTLEEKRRNERNHLLTIEEKRALQKAGKLPVIPHKKWTMFDDMQTSSIVILVLSMLMSWFVTYRINVYFSWGYASIFFLFAHAIFIGIFFLSKKRKKLGLGVNIVMTLLMLISSLLMYKINDFTNQVFDNSESEMVMLVAKKDSSISEKDDFKNKKIAFIKSDGDTNSFAKEMLSEAKKDTYEENVYVTYKEAYEALMKKDVDMMIYTSFTKQRLAEDDIQSWDEIKVVMQKSRALKAVESKKVDISKDPFNIYISGVDLTSYSINEKGSSDVNIIMTVNPKTEKIIMQTIPRDTWAGLSCSNGEHTKLTYAGAYGGIDCSIKTIEEFVGIDINYYAKINFQGVIDLVDALGGITVNSDVSFCEAHPLEGYGVKDYCYNAGVNTLNGIDALMFARIRKVFSDGDVERGRHQMEVVNAVIRKFSESPSLGNINALLGAVEDNFTTNLEEEDIGRGLELLLGMKDNLTRIESATMEGGLVWKTDEVTGEYLYYFIPNDGQVDLLKQRIQDVMDGK